MPDESFDDFYRDDLTRLVAFLCKAGFGLEPAKDAANEVMTLAYKNWSSIRSPRAWVRKAAFRAAVKEAERTRTEAGRAAASGWLVDSYVDIAGHAEVEEQPTIKALLARLPPQQQQVMAWHLEDFRAGEIAEVMGLEPATVRSHLRHARDALRSIFEKSRSETAEATRCDTVVEEVPHHGSAE